MRIVLACVVVALACLIGCAGAEKQEAEPEPEPTEMAKPVKEEEALITVTSAAFGVGTAIPRRYTGEGEDVSPALAWSNAPEGTIEFALICDDPDAPRPEPWVHWVLYGIPSGTDSLAEGTTGVGTEGKNSWGTTGYGGPMPPPGHGVHHYFFTIYALDQPVVLEPGATKKELIEAMEGHILAEGKLIGTYER
jgi:Raf kinase inhibitor-like YbhB/YbcL family protein